MAAAAPDQAAYNGTPCAVCGSCDFFASDNYCSDCGYAGDGVDEGVPQHVAAMAATATARARGSLGPDVVVDLRSLASRIVACQSRQVERVPGGWVGGSLRCYVGGRSGYITFFGSEEGAYSHAVLGLHVAEPAFDGGGFTLCVGGRDGSEEDATLQLILSVHSVIPSLDLLIASHTPTDEVSAALQALLSEGPAATTIDVVEVEGEDSKWDDPGVAVLGTVAAASGGKREWQPWESGLCVKDDMDSEYVLFARLRHDPTIGCFLRFDGGVTDATSFLLQPESLSEAVLTAPFAGTNDGQLFGDLTGASVIHQAVRVGGSVGTPSFLVEPRYTTYIRDFEAAAGEALGEEEFRTCVYYVVAQVACAVRGLDSGGVAVAAFTDGTLHFGEQKSFTDAVDLLEGAGVTLTTRPPQAETTFFDKVVRGGCEEFTSGAKSFAAAVAGCVTPLLPCFVANELSDTGCWDMRSITSPVNLTRAYIDVGNAVAAYAGNNTKANVPSTTLYVNSELSITYADGPCHRERDGRWTVLHHPFLCELSSCVGNSPACSCARPSHIALGSQAANTSQQQQQFAVADELGWTIEGLDYYEVKARILRAEPVSVADRAAAAEKAGYAVKLKK